jgi:hypothetical protein
MKVRWIVVAVVTASLVGCSPHWRPGSTQSGDVPSDAVRSWGAKPNTPQVEIVNDAVIVVDQEPIFIPGSYIDKKVTWEIVPANSRYTFESVRVDADSGVVAFTDCAVIASGKKAKCENNGKPGKYKYTIKVTGPAAVPELDPWIWNGR